MGGPSVRNAARLKFRCGSRFRMTLRWKRLGMRLRARFLEVEILIIQTASREEQQQEAYRPKVTRVELRSIRELPFVRR